MRAVPVIIPVSFVLVEGRVVFSPGTLEGAERALSGAVVAFETDHRSEDGRSGWDVHVTGVASQLADETRPLEFRLSSEMVSGSRSGP